MCFDYEGIFCPVIFSVITQKSICERVDARQGSKELPASNLAKFESEVGKQDRGHQSSHDPSSQSTVNTTEIRKVDKSARVRFTVIGVILHLGFPNDQTPSIMMKVAFRLSASQVHGRHKGDLQIESPGS